MLVIGQPLQLVRLADRVRYGKAAYRWFVEIWKETSGLFLKSA
ncbi:hypothetical protein IMCC12053_2885 [Celeribacter marinus]|uniref:Uncharacterized protein n=1 Tax=Celeribacter marinus TaxID=1397108 RepID=A0A0P0A204_9RHOB|nr:hypothetical protein IMCC12053_2885 [Celeribacter marinus]